MDWLVLVRGSVMMISRSPLTEFSFTLEGGPKAAESRRKEPGSASQNQTQTTDRERLTDRLLTERDWQTDYWQRETDRQTTDRQTDRQLTERDWQTDYWERDWQTDYWQRETDRQTTDRERLTDRLLTDRQTDRQLTERDWQTDNWQRETDRQTTERETDRQTTDRETDRQTYRLLTDREPDRQTTDRQTDYWQTNRLLTDREPARQTDRQTDYWQTDRQTTDRQTGAAFQFLFYALHSLSSLRLVDSVVRLWLRCMSAHYWRNPWKGLNWNVLTPWSLRICYGVCLLFTFFPLWICLVQHSIRAGTIH